MTNRTRFPIRLKILLSLLFVVTAVVSVITFTMATLFHEDKTAYIKGLISLVSRSAAEETQSQLVGYGERLEVYARIMRNTSMDAKSKSELLSGLFDDFPELVAVTLYEGGEETAQAYDVLYPDLIGLKGIAKRAAFVIDREGKVVHQEIMDDARQIPDLDVAVAKMKASG